MVWPFVLFAHVVGMLMFFIALGVESVQVALLRRDPTQAHGEQFAIVLALLARLYPLAGLLLLLSGGYLATTMGLWTQGWLLVGLGAFLAMAIAGRRTGARIRVALAASVADRAATETLRRHLQDPILAASVHLRVAVALGIVYVMMFKPSLIASLLIVGATLAAGLAPSLMTRSSVAEGAR
jgi:hypothetical protein